MSPTFVTVSLGSVSSRIFVVFDWVKYRFLITFGHTAAPSRQSSLIFDMQYLTLLCDGPGIS